MKGDWKELSDRSALRDLQSSSNSSVSACTGEGVADDSVACKIYRHGFQLSTLVLNACTVSY
jgi:hypothetical protein